MAVSGGRLGAIEGTTTTYKTLYKPASGTLATVSVQVCNRFAGTRTIRIALAQSASTDPTPGDGEFLVYDTVIQAAGDASDRDKLLLSGLVLFGTNNDQIVVYTSGIDVDFKVFGVTEA